MPSIDWISKYAVFMGQAATPWYLEGGVNPANCIVAYQPKGAASYAASKINLANPGTNDANEGVAPGWTTGNGWQFDGINDYLRTMGVVPAVNWSMIIQYANSDTPGFVWGIAGVNQGGTQVFGLNSAWGNNCHYYHGSVGISKAPQLLTGNLCVAGTKCYRDGVDEGLVTPNSANPTNEIRMGIVNGTPNYRQIDFYALAIYDVQLSGAQVTAIHAAMSAL